MSDEKDSRGMMSANSPFYSFYPTPASLRASAPPRLKFGFVFSFFSVPPCLRGRFCFPDHARSPDVPITRSFSPTPSFFNFRCKQRLLRKSSQGPPLRDACMTLGRRLRHPWDTQSQSLGSPNQAAGHNPKTQKPGLSQVSPIFLRTNPIDNLSTN
jgi:hypothetical protein